ncbi:hypothetical protein CCACVL1_03258 [Corchorus capsularis]|uniref:Uncharacterized protein n=1 Tax=Corchorus capsularis TaxID=210143 RepID=A0A1R3K1F8_COCAP|nr:hypothetical protein CCACVL1_03258 [Corchorus capsularis]
MAKERLAIARAAQGLVDSTFFLCASLLLIDCEAKMNVLIISGG